MCHNLWDANDPCDTGEPHIALLPTAAMDSSARPQSSDVTQCECLMPARSGVTCVICVTAVTAVKSGTRTHRQPL